MDELAVDNSSEEIPHPCEHEGCDRNGLPCWLPCADGEEGAEDDDTPDHYYCGEHCHGEGFCWSCGWFWAGVESFDFDSEGLCDNCRDEYEDSDDDEEYDFPYVDPYDCKPLINAPAAPSA